MAKWPAIFVKRAQKPTQIKAPDAGLKEIGFGGNQQNITRPQSGVLSLGKIDNGFFLRVKNPQTAIRQAERQNHEQSILEPEQRGHRDLLQPLGVLLALQTGFETQPARHAHEIVAITIRRFGADVMDHLKQIRADLIMASHKSQT